MLYKILLIKLLYTLGAQEGIPVKSGLGREDFKFLQRTCPSID